MNSILTIGENSHLTVGHGAFLTLGSEDISENAVSFNLNLLLEWTKDYIKLTIKLPLN